MFVKGRCTRRYRIYTLGEQHDGGVGLIDRLFIIIRVKSVANCGLYGSSLLSGKLEMAGEEIK